MKLRVNIDLFNEENESAVIPNCFTEVIIPVDKSIWISNKKALASEVEQATNLLRVIFQAKANNIKIF